MLAAATCAYQFFWSTFPVTSVDEPPGPSSVIWVGDLTVMLFVLIALCSVPLAAHRTLPVAPDAAVDDRVGRRGSSMLGARSPLRDRFRCSMGIPGIFRASRCVLGVPCRVCRILDRRSGDGTRCGWRDSGAHRPNYGKPYRAAVRRAPCHSRARSVPDRVAIDGVERTTADKGRTAVDLRTHGQNAYDNPVPKLIVVQQRGTATYPSNHCHRPPSTCGLRLTTTSRAGARQ